MTERTKGIVEEVNAGRFREAGALIERGLQQDPAALGPYGVNLANWLVLAANWPLVSRLLVPGTNFFSFADGVRYLDEAGWMRIDFFGLIPCYAYKNCTSIFFRDTC